MVSVGTGPRHLRWGRVWQAAGKDKAMKDLLREKTDEIETLEMMVMKLSSAANEETALRNELQARSQVLMVEKKLEDVKKEHHV